MATEQQASSKQYGVRFYLWGEPVVFVYDTAAEAAEMVALHLRCGANWCEVGNAKKVAEWQREQAQANTR